jgi:hypothetical protein
MDSKEISNYESNRRFGVEIELNAFDLLSKPLNDKLLPKGIEEVACKISKTLCTNVVVTKWQNDHNNSNWGVKPDSSCGIEIVSPVLKGIHGIEKVCDVVDLIDKNNFSADKRCSVHVHVDVSDMTDKKLLSILTWWIKCEPIFFDSVMDCRKLNSYCMFISMNKMFKVNSSFYTLNELMNLFGVVKYYSLNTYHKKNKRRDTIEFRIMDNDCCNNADDMRNWIKLILHFCECCIKKGMPETYREKDYMSGYCWIDPYDFFSLLKMNNDYELTKELTEIKNWLIKRIKRNLISKKIIGFSNLESRQHAYEQIKSMI